MPCSAGSMETIFDVADPTGAAILYGVEISSFCTRLWKGQWRDFEMKFYDAATEELLFGMNRESRLFTRHKEHVLLDSPHGIQGYVDMFTKFCPPDKFKVTDANGELLFKVVVANRGIFGWKFNVMDTRRTRVAKMKKNFNCSSFGGLEIILYQDLYLPHKMLLITTGILLVSWVDVNEKVYILKQVFVFAECGLL